MVFHFDVYRITDEEDLYSTGFYELAESGGITVIEWSENIPYAIFPDAIRVRIEPVYGEPDEEGNVKRTITIDGLSDREK